MDLTITSLKESNSFLNDLYENVTSAIFIADSEPRIHSFNDAFKTLFYKPEDQILRNLCGNAIGCIFTVEEHKDCGETSNCSVCILRECIIRTFTEKVPVYKQRLDRKFLINGSVLDKNFIFTTKYVSYNGSDLILVIVDDVTELEMQKKRLEALNRNLQDIVRYGVSDMVNMAERLSSETREKEVLMQELHHRVGNTLQIISSLLRLQTHNHEQQLLEDALREVDSRIQTINLLYRELLNSYSLSDIHIGKYLQSLKSRIFNFYLTEKQEVLLDISNDASILPISIAMPLGLAVNEAFHCFLTDGKLPQGDFIFSVAVFKDGGNDHFMKISIKCNFPGIEVRREGFIGVTLIKALVGQINGTFSLAEDGEKTITIKFSPVKASRHIRN